MRSGKEGGGCKKNVEKSHRDSGSSSGGSGSGSETQHPQHHRGDNVSREPLLRPPPPASLLPPSFCLPAACLNMRRLRKANFRSVCLILEGKLRPRLLYRLPPPPPPPLSIHIIPSAATSPRTGPFVSRCHPSTCLPTKIIIIILARGLKRGS